jgi:UDP-N-acetylglucosamine:LPS N-acetylglucosamine transferase
LRADFGAELTDPKWNNSKVTDAIISPIRYLSYWSIKDRAEFHVSRVPLVRAVFNLVFKLKSPTEERNGRHHQVFVIGHSFGALLLEQAIGQAVISALAEA